jgi:hypothetical protein
MGCHCIFFVGWDLTTDMWEEAAKTCHMLFATDNSFNPSHFYKVLEEKGDTYCDTMLVFFSRHHVVWT